MLQTINKENFACAIKQSYKGMTEEIANSMASELVELLDPTLEEAVSAWIEGVEVPDVAFEKYSISKILTIKNSTNYLEAFKLLSSYINDPEAGEQEIWTPANNLF